MHLTSRVDRSIDRSNERTVAQDGDEGLGTHCLPVVVVVCAVGQSINESIPKKSIDPSKQ
jgi:hypothetical protein